MLITYFRMFFLVVWQCMLLSVTCRHDTPIVIERPLNRVEFDDLLMEYNKDQGPTVDVTVSALGSKIYRSSLFWWTKRKRKRFTTASLFRSELTSPLTALVYPRMCYGHRWRWNRRGQIHDLCSKECQKYRFVAYLEGNRKSTYKSLWHYYCIQLPSNVQPWHPDTVIINALSNDVKVTSTFLNYDGTIRRKQLCYVEVICEESNQSSEVSAVLVSLTGHLRKKVLVTR